MLTASHTRFRKKQQKIWNVSIINRAMLKRCKVVPASARPVWQGWSSDFFEQGKHAETSVNMQLYSLPSYFHRPCYIYTLSLLLKHSQVRPQTLNGYVSILCGGSVEYENLGSCCQGCLYLETSANNGLVNVLGCDIPVLNECYCRADQLQIATSTISECVNWECTNVDSVDISTAIQVYTDYCNEVPAKGILVTTTAESSTISKPNSFFKQSRPLYPMQSNHD